MPLLTLMMIRAFIPRFRQVHSDHSRLYTVFEIEVFISGKCHKVERRYRAFHNLHKQLKKTLTTPVFPPKRVRNLNPKILEQRRQGLENYIQSLLRIKPLPKQLISFLAIPNSSPSSSIISDETVDVEKGITHQPVLTFTSDPYVESISNDLSSDMLVRGVLMGFYSSDEENMQR